MTDIAQPNSTRSTARILSTPSILVCLVFLCSFLAEATEIDLGYGARLATPSILNVIAFCVGLWWWALYEELAIKAGELGLRSRAIDRLAYCILAVVLIVSSVASFWMHEPQSQPILTAFLRTLVWVLLIALFAALWGTADLLVRLEDSFGTKASSVSPTIFQLFFLPVGIWILRPRVNAVLMQTAK